MRSPKYLSPSALGCWLDDQQEYYLRYLADNRPPRFAQTQPMSVGSAFDAYVKSYITERLYGEIRDEFALEPLLKEQCSEEHLDWARIAGKVVFDAYKQSGALTDLMIELQKASEEPRFEFLAQGEVRVDPLVEGPTLMGKPDCYYVSDAGAHVIVDWKVNGYCSKNGVSPKKGYVKCRDGWVGKQSRSHLQTHKDCHLYHLGGIDINIGHFFEEIDESWARQLSIYAWLIGEEVGSNFIICIEQLACKPGKIRVASHRMRASKGFQLNLMKQLSELWAIIKSGYIFRDVSREESDKRCRTLDKYYLAFEGGTPNDDWFNSVTRGR